MPTMAFYTKEIQVSRKQEPQEPKTNTIIYLHRTPEGRSSHTHIGSVDAFMTATPQVGATISVTFKAYHHELGLNYDDDRFVRGHGEVTNVEWVVDKDRVLKAWINVLVKYAYRDSDSTLVFND